jgi:hypothetical protein
LLHFLGWLPSLLRLKKETDQLSAAFTVIIDRIGLIGRAITKLFDSDFSGAWEDVKASVEGVGEEIANVVEQAGLLSDAFAKLRDDQIANIAVDARLRKELKQYNLDAENINLTLEERAEASRKAEAAEAQRIANSMALQREEIRIIQERQKLGNNVAEDNRELAEAQARLFQLEEESLERLTTQGNKTRLLLQQIRTEAEAARQAMIDADIQAITDELEREQAKADAIVAINKAKEAELEALTDATLEAQIAASIASAEADDKIAAATLKAKEENANTVAGIAGKLASFQLDAALGEIQAQLAVALAKAFGQLGPIGGAVASAAVLTAFNFISSKLKSIVLPTPPKFEKGGWINGPSHKRGGVHIEAEGGEYIINKRSMRDPGVRAAAEHLNSIVPKFAFGGRVPDSNNIGVLANALSNIPATQAVLVLEDLQSVENRVATTEDLATL